MKKWLIVSFVFIFAIFLLIFLTYFKTDTTQDGITGKQIDQSVSVSVSVVGIPTLTINSPKNHTYFNNTIRLSISSNGDNFWYSLDSEGNVSFNKEANLSVSSGSHIIYVYSNNTDGLSSKSVTFNINQGIFEIFYQEFSGLTAGSSTDFNGYSYEEIQDSDEIVLENSNYGKIIFESPINLTADLISNDGEIDIDRNVNISHNRIELNSTALPNFNKSATLTLYSISYSNPEILKDGNSCSECVLNYYSGGVLSFNVSSFSTYSSRESSQESGSSSSGGGGGGGSFGSVVFFQPSAPDFSVNPETLGVRIISDNEIVKKIKIVNLIDRNIDINLKQERLNDLVSFSQEQFIIPAKGEVEILAVFSAPEYVSPGI